MRRTPVHDPFEDHDDPSYDPGPEVRRISTGPASERTPRRAELRPLQGARRVPPKRGPDRRVWFIRGSLGVAALAGLWLGLQALFPVTESRVSQAPTPAQPIDASAVGAPEPPVVQPTAQQPAPTPVTQAPPAAEGDRLPGLPTPVPGAASQAAPAAPAATDPAPAAAQPAPAQPVAEGQSAPAESQPAPAQPEAAALPQPADEPKPREENPSQLPVGTPTLEPIPPPPGAQAANPPAAPAVQQAPRAAVAPPPPAPKPQAPPPAASSGGAFELSASASPANPVSEQAVVTISVRATRGGAPLAGATCMATIYYRTNTVKQPSGGFATNASGVGSFTLDARNTTYGHYIPVDVTCSGRGGTATARTGFTPVKGR